MMLHQFPFEEVEQTPNLVKDYLSHSANISHQKILVSTKKKEFFNRNIVAEILQAQHQNLQLTTKQSENLRAISREHTFTITTGHQLNFLTGSVFFIYKIVQTIKLCDELNELQSQKQFVPIFWLASEDHDFEEIQFFHIKNQKYSWQTNQKGAVGTFSTENARKELELFFNENPEYRKTEKEIHAFFQENPDANVSEFTRFIVNLWFKDYGLLIIDGNSKELKKLMIPYFEKELTEQLSFQAIQKTIENFKKNNYKIQVNPREINLFYLHQNGRDRIVKNDDSFQVLNTNLSFSESEILNELHQFPEKFSPNALLRPLYQEVVLPNVCYIGGNAEIAYWLQLTAYFEAVSVPFPVIIPRNSFFIFTEKDVKKMKEFDWEFSNFFADSTQIFNSYIKKNTSISIDFEQNKRVIQDMYLQMKREATKTDSSLQNLLQAQEKKQLRAFDSLHKRLLKAERKIHDEKWQKFNTLYNRLFPNGTWQERRFNVLHFTQENQQDFIATIYQSTQTTIPACICTVFEY